MPDDGTRPGVFQLVWDPLHDYLKDKVGENGLRTVALGMVVIALAVSAGPLVIDVVRSNPVDWTRPVRGCLTREKSAGLIRQILENCA